MFEDSNLLDFFIICFKVLNCNNINSITPQCNYLTIVQDALANFIEILPDMPELVLAKKVKEIVGILLDKLQIAMTDVEMEREEDFKRILVCNNGCWLIGELANKCPDQMKEHMIDIIDILAGILNTGILTKLREKDEQILKHFSKTISITLGRLGMIDPQ